MGDGFGDDVVALAPEADRVAGTEDQSGTFVIDEGFEIRLRDKGFGDAIGPALALVEDLDDVSGVQFGQEGEDGPEGIVIPDVVGGMAEDDGLVLWTVGSEAEGPLGEEFGGVVFCCRGGNGGDDVQFGDEEGGGFIIGNGRVILALPEELALNLEEGLVESLVPFLGLLFVGLNGGKRLNIDQEEAEEQDVEAAEEADELVAHYFTAISVSVNDSTLFLRLFKGRLSCQDRDVLVIAYADHRSYRLGSVVGGSACWHLSAYGGSRSRAHVLHLAR